MISRCSATSSVKRALKMILVTAQRPGEVAQMHRNQITGRWWTIPADVAKNSREHRVYLSDMALELIADEPFHIFTSEKGKKKRGHITTNALSQAINGGTTIGRHVIFEREALYKLVWAKPLREVATVYAVSDVTIKKVCEHLEVPVPPRGYWISKNISRPLPLPSQSEGVPSAYITNIPGKVAVPPYFELEPWSPHDLRRTARTGMGRCRVPDRYIEEVLNHRPKKLIRIYDKNKYDVEKRGC